MPDTSASLRGALALVATLVLAGCPAKGTRVLGATCKSGGDCVSGDCDTQIPGGYCTQECATGGSCPSTATCAASPAGQKECLLSCTTTDQCPVGDLCTSTQTCVPPSSPITNCTDTNQCPSGYTCDTSSGDCVLGALTNVGGACASNSDCTGGNQPQCLTDAQNFTGGYCTSACTENTDCGSAGECVGGFIDSNGNAYSQCLQTCTMSSDCRTNYQCQPQDGTLYCYPQDCRANPLACTLAQTCDTTTGACQSRLPNPGYPAMPLPVLPMVEFSGGSVLANPKIVGVFFSNDDMSVVSQMEQFFAGIGSSVYWSALSEYGVGAGTGTSVILNETAPTSIDDTASSFGNSALQTWLLNEISSGNLPQPDANTEYMISYPTGTSITEGGGMSCTSFGGYHSDINSNNNYIAYGVLPRCPAGGSGFTDMQLLTGSASHEIIEAATDPYPDLDPAYSFADVAHLFYDEANDGSEVGDMCENDPEAFHQFLDFPFVVQRFWSNHSAAAGHDPCQPSYPDEVFFNSVPAGPNPISFDFFGQTVSVDGTRIAVGATGTVTVNLYSDYETSAWSVQLYDYNALETGGAPLLAFTAPESTNGKNGSSQTWTVQVMAAGNENSNGQVNNTELFAVVSQQGNSATSPVHITWGLIGD